MMKRRRWLRPEFFTDEEVLALPIPARLTFLGLLMYADAFGRERLNGRLLKAAVWPLDDEITAEAVEEHLVLIDERGLIETYAAEGREYYQVTWSLFIPDKDPAASEVPYPPPAALSHARTPEMAQRDVSAEPAGAQRKEREGERGESEGGESASEGEREGSVGEAAVSTPDDPHGPPPDPFCPRHPDGSDAPCRPCGRARLRFQRWQASRTYSEESQ